MEMESYNRNQVNRTAGGGGSLSNTSSSDFNRSSSSNSISLSNSNQQNHHHPIPHPQLVQYQQSGHHQEDPMQSWWESVSKARSRIQALLSLLPDCNNPDSLSSLADSDRPARTLLDSYDAYSAVSSALSGSGDDPLCQWLYDTFQQSSDSDSDSDLQLVVLSFVPVVAGLYLSRIHAFSTTSPSQPSPSLAGFEAVLLAVYTSETKSRSGKPLLVSIPTPAYLSQHPSLYHQPTSVLQHSNSKPSISSTVVGVGVGVGVGVLSPPLEPQVGIKSTKRGCIVGVAFHSFYSHISQMPSWSKRDLCHFAASWAGNDCSCALSIDFHVDNFDEDNADAPDFSLTNGDTVSSFSSPSSTPKAMTIAHNHSEIIQSEDMARLRINENSDNQATIIDHDQGARIPLPWELLQPMLRILGHCLLAPLNSDDIKDAAAVAVRHLYARASHDLSPQAIIATRSLVQIHSRARASAKVAALVKSNPSSNATTPRPKKPEVLLVSK